MDNAIINSFYEYLLKIWILTGKTNDKWKRMYLESVEGTILSHHIILSFLHGMLILFMVCCYGYGYAGMREHLLTKSSEGLWYLADLENGHKQHKMDHLVCFAPAMLALGMVDHSFQCLFQ
jgi:hypothetical protein